MHRMVHNALVQMKNSITGVKTTDTRLGKQTRIACDETRTFNDNKGAELALNIKARRQQ